MSWLYSRALAAACLEATCSDGDLSALLSATPMPQAYCSPDKTTELSRLARYGMTFAPLTDERGAELLKWCQADSHARTSVSQDQAQESTERAADCGEKWPASLARYDLNSRSWKTAQRSLIEDSGECLETWPRSGMTRNGECYQRPMLVRRTSVKGCGLLPTPTASAMPCEGTVRLMRAQWLEGNYTLEEASAIAGRDVRKSQGKIAEWFPTPCASMHKGSSPAALTRKSGRDRTNDRPDHFMQSTESGRLNPEWVEWLMGWPAGHTDLKPLEMARFREWQQQHSLSYASAPDGREPSVG